MTTESVCLCGTNRISFAGEPLTKFRCHCTDERHLTGNGFSNNLLMPTDNPTVLRGTLKTNARKASSGNTITTHFCGECGSLLYRTSDGYPGTMVVKVGCIDDDGRTNAEYVPDVEIFTRSRVPWMKPIEGARQDIADFMKGLELYRHAVV